VIPAADHLVAESLRKLRASAPGTPAPLPNGLTPDEQIDALKEQRVPLVRFLDDSKRVTYVAVKALGVDHPASQLLEALR
jgi:hypothetical protein